MATSSAGHTLIGYLLACLEALSNTAYTGVIARTGHKACSLNQPCADIVDNGAVKMGITIT